MLRETVLRANEDLKRRLYNLRMAVEVGRESCTHAGLVLFNFFRRLPLTTIT